VTEQERANGLLAGISERLIRVVPPAFLMLIVLNIVFLGVFWWVFDHNVSARTELLNRIVEKCLLRP
jgi:Na+-transporting NADH:ubiquinone oxidoreductase subunit NqrB